MATQRDESPSGLSDIVEPDGLLGIGLTVRFFLAPLGVCVRL
jgi:division protein 1